MKLILTTVYENVDQEWLDWWLSKAGPNYGINPDEVDFTIGCTHVISSNDPTSDVKATTAIKVHQ